jgi:para-aminobenzoate synthetase/4-amino-4-deoxychorismate lyase
VLEKLALAAQLYMIWVENAIDSALPWVISPRRALGYNCGVLAPSIAPEVLIHDPDRGGWLRFRQPVGLLTAHQTAEVMPALRELDRAVAEQGLYAAGFVSYEAGPGCDPALPAHPPGGFPLLWFGLFRQPERVSNQQLWRAAPAQPFLPAWTASVSREAYAAAIEQIKTHIERGHTYQVNYTFRLSFPFAADPLAYFLQLVRAQRAPYAAFVQHERYSLCSASPELFFTLDGERIRSKPMKGTAPRGLTRQQDLELADWLFHSEKNRAENVMIVDMVRNDIGKIARTGSVQVPELYALEQYPTVWQMVSTVTGETPAPPSEIFRALFPAASITGAPKARTMQIIHELETTPRRSYTGCIGYLAPGRVAQFNVAIRTVLIDRAEAQAEYGVGGGITWDSLEAAEYEECLTKARVLTRRASEFSLLESLRWAPAEGYFLLAEHLERLGQSAAYFSFPIDLPAVRARLLDCASAFGPQARKVRLLLDEQGGVTVESQVLPPAASAAPLQVGLAPEPVAAADPFLYHKTTFRRVYEAARAACEAQSGRAWDDVLLWNENGELTEATLANVLVELDGALCTPPLRCGLLPGTYRTWLLARGQAQERVIRLEELLAEPPIYLVNSVRGVRPARLSLPDWLRGRQAGG